MRRKKTCIKKYILYMAIVVAVMVPTYVLGQEIIDSITMIIPSPKIEAKVEAIDKKLNIDLSWKLEEPDQFGYILERRIKDSDDEFEPIYYEPPGGNDVSTGGYYLDDDLGEGKTYIYTVTAYDADGNLSEPAQISVVAQQPSCGGSKAPGISWFDPKNPTGDE